MYETVPVKRYKRTMDFMKSTVGSDLKILDLGVNNPFSEIMRMEQYNQPVSRNL